MSESKFILGPIQTEWIKQLRDHPQWQGKSTLGWKNKGGFKMCCLGLLGQISGTCAFDDGGCLKELIDGKPVGNDDFLENTYTLVGLHSDTGVILGSPEFQTSLVSLNDSSGGTWADIADLVEANPERVFNKSF